MILNIFKYLEAQTNLTHLIEFSNEFQWNLIITWNQQNRSTFKCIKPLREAGGDLWVRVGVPPNPILTRSEFILFWQTGDRRQERHQNKLKYKWLPPPPPIRSVRRKSSALFRFLFAWLSNVKLSPTPSPSPPIPLKMHENLWKYMKSDNEYMRIYEIYENAWIYMRIHENIWK